MGIRLKLGGSALATVLVLALGLGVASSTALPSCAFADEPVAQTATVAPRGLVREADKLRFYKKGKAITEQWKVVDGGKYYFDAKGNAVSSKSAKIDGKYWIFDNSGKLLTPKKARFAQLKGGIYYVDKKGHPAKTGWILQDDKLRYVMKNGRVKTSGEKQGIVFKKNGYAKNDLACKLKITVMKRIAAVTQPSWSKEKKLQACWNWARFHGPHVNAGAVRDLDNPGWVQRQAYSTFNRNDHDCFGATATFAMMAYELGYKPVIYASVGIHAFTYIGNKLYDSASLTLHNMKGERKFIVDSYASGMPEKITRDSQVRAPSGGTGWVTAVGNKYYFRHGSMLKSQWVTVKGSKYYLKSNGTAVVNGSFNAKKSNSSSKKAYFVFGKTGKLLAGTEARLVKVNGKKYGVTAKGQAQTGWSSDKKYYFTKNGAMATGVNVVKSKVTVFKSNGVFNASATSKIRKLLVAGNRLEDCLPLLGEQTKKAVPSNSCRPPLETIDGTVPGEGKEYTRTFGKLKVYTYCAPDSDVEYIVMFEG